MPGRTNHRVGLALPNQYARLWAHRHQQPTLTTPGPQNQSRPPLPQCRMQFPQSLLTRRYENGGISTVRVHNLKYLEGNCMRNLSPADERWPQGLRTHIDTFTMRTCSGSSAKILAHHGPSRSSSAKNSPRTPPSTASPVQNSPRTPPPTPHPVQKLSPHSRKHPIWALFRVQGEYIHACGSNRPSRANIFTHADQTSQAEELRLRTQPPLRLNTRPPTSAPQHSGTPHRQGR